MESWAFRHAFKEVARAVSSKRVWELGVSAPLMGTQWRCRQVVIVRKTGIANAFFHVFLHLVHVRRQTPHSICHLQVGASRPRVTFGSFAMFLHAA